MQSAEHHHEREPGLYETAAVPFPGHSSPDGIPVPLRQSSPASLAAKGWQEGILDRQTAPPISVSLQAKLWQWHLPRLSGLPFSEALFQTGETIYRPFFSLKKEMVRSFCQRSSHHEL